MMQDLRRDYKSGELLESNIQQSPFEQFQVWFNDALGGKILEPNAMTLATCDHNKPSARIVLLKGVDARGFVFYTNYQSRKGNDIENNPHAALLFFWDALERQIRIEGVVERIDRENTEIYFKSRPKDSRIGALASPQSTVIENREVLEQKMNALKEQYSNNDEIPVPPYWGGYRLVPHYFEFWQGRRSRLHDRIVYEKQTDANWKTYRLAP
jgi:pyridoxamine 5'-phosphate oxidase